MELPAICVKTHRNPRITLSETKSVLYLQNPKLHEVQVIEIDKCVLKNAEGQKCDYLVQIEETKTSLLIELKGSDIPKGYEQIKATAHKLKEHLKPRQIWIVICSGTPRIITSEQQKIIRETKKASITWRVQNSHSLYIL